MQNKKKDTPHKEKKESITKSVRELIHMHHSWASRTAKKNRKKNTSTHTFWKNSSSALTLVLLASCVLLSVSTIKSFNLSSERYD